MKAIDAVIERQTWPDYPRGMIRGIVDPAWFHFVGREVARVPSSDLKFHSTTMWDCHGRCSGGTSFRLGSSSTTTGVATHAGM